MRMTFTKTRSHFCHSYPYIVFICLYFPVRRKQRTTLNNVSTSILFNIPLNYIIIFSGNCDPYNTPNNTSHQFLKSQVTYYTNQLAVNPFTNEAAVNHGKFNAIID